MTWILAAGAIGPQNPPDVLAISARGCYPRSVRGIVSVVVTLCLMAAGGARAEETRRSEAHGAQLVGVSHALVATLMPRRDGTGSELRIAPFTIPALALDVAAPPSTVLPLVSAPQIAAVTRLPARSSRGPPGSGSFVR